MVVFSNRRLGASTELLVSVEIASALLLATADAARPLARSRWEHELIRWLERSASDLGGPTSLDVTDLAWTPEHFEAQRAFLIDAIGRAGSASEHGSSFASALERWARMILAHPRDSVSVGRLWRWPVSAATV